MLLLLCYSAASQFPLCGMCRFRSSHTLQVLSYKSSALSIDASPSQIPMKRYEFRRLSHVQLIEIASISLQFIVVPAGQLSSPSLLPL